MRRIALITAGVVILLAIVSQLVLPGIAARQLRDRLARSGRVLSVEVSAFPAIQLLWHHADRVEVRMASYSSTPAELDSLLAQTSDAGTLDASVGQLQTGLLSLRDASLHKRGDHLTGSATVTESALRSSYPILQSVEPIASAGGQLTLRGTASLFGVSATVDATVQAQDGALVVTPDVPFGALATITLFSSPSVALDAVAATAVTGGFKVSADAVVK